MKIFVHDYPGHAFPIHLSRTLARQGHTVVHAFAHALESPRGGVQARPDDPPSLRIHPLIAGESMPKYALVRRVIEERRYGRLLASLVRAERPDLFITCTTPNDVLDVLRQRLPRDLRTIWWLQDIYSIGIKSVLNRKLPFSGSVVGSIYRAKEKAFAARANHIVSVTADFIPFLKKLRVPDGKITVIENWAPVEEIIPLARENEWKHAQGLAGKKIILYSGTLGLKHNPGLLTQVAMHYQKRNRDDVALVVVTQGLGAKILSQKIEEQGIRNLKVLPWQPYEQLPQVLSSADILVAIIEPEAGTFSVPSKILACLCAGRPLVASIPFKNLAAQTIQSAKAGLVVEPHEENRFISEIDRLLNQPDLADNLGRNGRAYAERNFNVESIAARFLALAG